MDVPVEGVLRGFVRRIRIVPAARVTYRRWPDGEAELIARVEGGAAMVTAIGPHGGPLVKPSTHADEVVLVRFRIAGAYPFLGPMGAYANGIVALPEPLAIGGGDPARAISRALASRLATACDPAAAAAVRRCVRRIATLPRVPTVRALADDVGASERALRRAFAEVVGLSPKLLLRITRFRRALAAARAPRRAEWAAIAAGAGYYDQAHLIDEFRALTGLTPGALVAPDDVGSSDR